MECHGIQEKLSAYIENLLSVEEKAQVDEHLRACLKCSLALEDLKKTIAHTQGLEEIEPPSWLSQKVMARVREEAGRKKGILQKLFFPLHIKIPVEVIATIAVVVTAFYVFKTIEPEMKQPEIISDQAILSEQEGPRDRLKKDEMFAEKEAPSEIYVPAKKKRHLETPGVPAGKMEKAEETARSAEEKIIPQKSYRAFDMKAERGAAGFAPESEIMPVLKKQGISLTVHVKDIEAAEKEIDNILMRLKGKIIKTEYFKDKDVITAELDSIKMKQLNEKLKVVGEIKEKDILYALKGDVKISIEIVKISVQSQ